MWVLAQEGGGGAMEGVGQIGENLLKLAQGLLQMSVHELR